MLKLLNVLRKLTCLNILGEAYSRHNKAKKKEKDKEYQNRIKQVKGSALFFSSEPNKKPKIFGRD